MIEFKDISFSYDKKGAPAVDGVTTAVGPGIHLLAGENGAGKTTLLHLIAGVATPTAGEIKIDSEPVPSSKPSVTSRIFLLEENTLFPARSIRTFAAGHSRFYPNFSNEQFDRNLSAFGLTGDERMREMSLGNRKKAQLAYVLALGVDIVLLDEPTNALDMQSKETLRKLLASTIRDTQTVIVATHTVSELENLFDGALMLSRSQLIFSGTADAVTQRLSFEITRMPEANAIYTEIQAGRVLNILPAKGEDSTRVDWRLLYMALHSPEGNKIVKILQS